MGTTRSDDWNSGGEVYTPNQVEGVLRDIGVQIQDIETSEFKSLCPYHGNADSAVFATSAIYGYSICFNPACAMGTEKRLTLEKLVMDLKGCTIFEAKRLIRKHRDSAGFQAAFDSIKIEEETLKEFSAGAVKKMHDRFMHDDVAAPARDYMTDRGFTMDTMDKFMVGFTPASKKPVYRAQDMIVVPAYDHRSRPVGLIGRSIIGKEFKNYGPEPDGTGLRKSKIIWNLNNARRSETVILTEATFDSMSVDQAGYSNVGALLGGSLSQTQAELIRRHFTTVIWMTDNETDNDIVYHKRCPKCVRMGHDMCQGHQPGRELAMRGIEMLPTLRHKWAVYDSTYIYANNVKDANSMNSDQIRQCLRNAISHFEYLDYIA